MTNTHVLPNDGRTQTPRADCQPDCIPNCNPSDCGPTICDPSSDCQPYCTPPSTCPPVTNCNPSSCPPDNVCKPDVDSTRPVASATTTFAWFWLTNECNEQCTHCYAGSGPLGKKSLLSTERWMELLTEAHDTGLEHVQFIGGEPTKYPELAQLIRHAFSIGLRIEVFTNMVDISEENWTAFIECQVSLATSFYSAMPEMHDRVTNSSGNQPKIVANIRRALSTGLPLRVGLIRVFDEQDIEGTMTFLQELGVSNIGTDDVRGIGRGSVHDTKRRKEDALCGQCAKGKICVDFLGRVFPCVFSQWLVVGNVRKSSLTDILMGNPIALQRERLTTIFAARHGNLLSMMEDDCLPKACSPNTPEPPPICSPNCRPSLCQPDFDDLRRPLNEQGVVLPLDTECWPKACSPDIPEPPPCSPRTDPCQPDADDLRRPIPLVVATGNKENPCVPDKECLPTLYQLVVFVPRSGVLKLRECTPDCAPWHCNPPIPNDRGCEPSCMPTCRPDCSPNNSGLLQAAHATSGSGGINCVPGCNPEARSCRPDG